jgi:hypothetical protein
MGKIAHASTNAVNTLYQTDWESTAIHTINGTANLDVVVNPMVSTLDANSQNITNCGDVGITSGGLIIPVVSKSSTYTATTSDGVILCDASAAWTLTLYTAVGNSGRQLIIKKTDSSANAVTVDGNASETIDGETTQVISDQYTSITVASDGSNWHII